MQDNREILIDKFFSNELSADEQLQFEQLLRNDAGFRSEVELHADLLGGIKKYGKTFLKAELADVYKEVKPEIKSYKPSSGGSGLWNIVKWFLLATVAGTAAFIYLAINNKVPVGEAIKTEMKAQQKKIEKSFKETIPELIRRDTIITVETVYHTIRSNKVRAGDTITVYGESQLKKMTTEPVVRESQ
jgi:hypothetical protein